MVRLEGNPHCQAPQIEPIHLIRYYMDMCVNFLFVGQYAQLQLHSKCTTSVQHTQPIHSKCTIPVQHAQLQARCTISGQDKLSHSIYAILDQDEPIQSKCNTSCQGKLIQSISGQQSTFIHSYTQQHSSTPIAPHQLGGTTQNLDAHQNSNSSNPNPRQKKTRVVTSETLKASKNASRYMEAIRHGESQSSVHGPRK